MLSFLKKDVTFDKKNKKLPETDPNIKTLFLFHCIKIKCIFLTVLNNIYYPAWDVFYIFKNLNFIFHLHYLQMCTSCFSHPLSRFGKLSSFFVKSWKYIFRLLYTLTINSRVQKQKSSCRKEGFCLKSASFILPV